VDSERGEDLFTKRQVLFFESHLFSASASLILLANLGESDEAAEQQVHCEYSRIGEPS